jgi:hypothetical protein
MKVLIVHAHPEPRSFNAALTRAAAATLHDTGHEPARARIHGLRRRGAVRFLRGAEGRRRTTYSLPQGLVRACRGNRQQARDSGVSRFRSPDS